MLGAWWLRTELQLADLYRAMGRVNDAEEVENELRRMLTYADANHPILSELRKRSKSSSLAINEGDHVVPFRISSTKKVIRKGRASAEKTQGRAVSCAPICGGGPTVVRQLLDRRILKIASDERPQLV
jgi:hypothetical protein